MCVQIIKRREEHKSEIETISVCRGDNPQIAYNSEGRITVRVPTSSDSDVMIVFDRPTSKSFIHFVKNGILELPHTTAWCAKCANEFNSELPF